MQLNMRALISMVLGLSVALTACGSDELSLTEYMESIDAAATVAGERGEELFAEAAGMTDLTPAELKAFLEKGLAELRTPLQAAVDELSPPDQLADLHDVMWGWHAEFITVESALASRASETADTAAGWKAFSDSPELEAYRAALAEGKRLCTGFQAELDAISAIGGFADAPWMPGELRGVVETALGCQYFPDRPEDVYRYP